MIGNKPQRNPRQASSATSDDRPPAKPSYRFAGKLPSALEHLREERCWVTWDYRWMEKTRKWTKPPLNPRTGRNASVSDSRTWGTFAEAQLGVVTFDLAGVGLVLTEDGGISGADLDHCITDSDSLTPLAAEVIGYAESYAEHSPSGEGIRLFLSDRVAQAMKDDGIGVEVYGSGRYLTVTGQHIDSTPTEIRSAPRTLARLVAAVDAARSEKRAKPNRARPKGNVGNGQARPGADFFRNVNGAALANLDVWVPELHPTARKQATGAWRVTSDNLGRNLEEDLAYHPDGIRDHGEEIGLTPIDAVQRRGAANDAKSAAFWLCQRLGIEPASLGWQGKSRGTTPPPNPPPPSDDDPPHWDVEPWPERVSGADVLDGICAVLVRHMVLPKHAVDAIALWVLHAWTIDAWEISAILIVVSPTKQCGKTTLLTLIFWITPRSELVSNATASPIFRLIEDAKPAVPTFLLDEGDSYLKPDKEDLRGILNSGWMRAAARVIRTDGDGSKRKARRFSTWAPKVIATIKAVADTLMDRGVIIPLRRKARSERVERFRMRDTAEFAELRQKACRWATDNVNVLRSADPDIPDGLQNRQSDNWRALIAIADAAGGDWPSRAREAAVTLAGSKSDDDGGIMLLRDIRRLFEEGRQEWLGAETLVDRLIELPETPWAEWRRGERAITSRGVAKLLEAFGIRSDENHRPRRYWRKDFETAWASYLPEEGNSSGTSG